MTGMKKVFLGGGLITLVVLGLIVLFVSGIDSTTPHGGGGLATSQARGDEGNETPAPPSGDREVNVLHPRLDPAFSISVSELAEIEPYYRAELRPQVAGVVDYIQKNRGDHVVKGEPLVRIAVPDRTFTAREMEALVEKAKKDRDLAIQKVSIAQAAVEIADAAIGQKKALEITADATLKYRKARRDRFTDLVRQEGASPLIAEEEQRDFEAAEGARQEAAAAVKRAVAEKKEAEASLRAANADLDYKESLIQVAEQEWNVAKAQEDYAVIRAPFDGVITQRSVDPGNFVQNASTSNTEPLLTVAREDLVTAVMLLPDNYGSYLSRGADVVIRIGDIVVNGKVTRFPLAIDKSAGKTIRVEADIFNGTRKADYDKFLASVKEIWPKVRKGADDPLPLFPRITGPGVRELEHPLIPGMTGRMRVYLKRFENVRLIPSDSIILRGGVTYIALVTDGRVHFQEIEVDAADPDTRHLAKVSLVTHEKNAEGEEQTVYGALTGQETIVQGRVASELSEGQQVKATLKSW